MTQSHTPTPLAKEIDIFVGNANGRGLIRIEEYGTGEHIASMPRGVKSEAQANEIMRRYNAHVELVQALTNLLPEVAVHVDIFTASDGYKHWMRAAKAKAPQ
jgi:hypothetical protein